MNLAQFSPPSGSPGQPQRQEGPFQRLRQWRVVSLGSRRGGLPRERRRRLHQLLSSLGRSWLPRERVEDIEVLQGPELVPYEVERTISGLLSGETDVPCDLN